MTSLLQPSRSPKPGSIEMAPSFNLFNQSFDSIGDTGFFNVGGPLDSALQSTSFGAGPIGLTLSLYLKKFNINFLLFEKFSTVRGLLIRSSFCSLY